MPLDVNVFRVEAGPHVCQGRSFWVVFVAPAWPDGGGWGQPSLAASLNG